MAPQDQQAVLSFDDLDEEDENTYSNLINKIDTGLSKSLKENMLTQIGVSVAFDVASFFYIESERAKRKQETTNQHAPKKGALSASNIASFISTTIWLKNFSKWLERTQKKQEDVNNVKEFVEALKEKYGCQSIDLNSFENYEVVSQYGRSSEGIKILSSYVATQFLKKGIKGLIAKTHQQSKEQHNNKATIPLSPQAKRIKNALDNKKFLKAVKIILIVALILAVSIPAVLGYFGVFHITANGSLTRITGIEAAFDSAIFGLGACLLFIIAPVVAIVGGIQTIRFVALAWRELFGTSTSGTFILRFLIPALPIVIAFFVHFALPGIVFQLIGLALSLLLNLEWTGKENKTPYIAYLFILFDAAWAGYEGSILSFVRDIIPAIKTTWTSGIIGILIMIAIFAFFTGIRSIFGSKG